MEVTVDHCLGLDPLRPCSYRKHDLGASSSVSCKSGRTESLSYRSPWVCMGVVANVAGERMCNHERARRGSRWERRVGAAKEQRAHSCSRIAHAATGGRSRGLDLKVQLPAQQAAARRSRRLPGSMRPPTNHQSGWGAFPLSQQDALGIWRHEQHVRARLDEGVQRLPILLVWKELSVRREASRVVVRDRCRQQHVREWGGKQSPRESVVKRQKSRKPSARTS